MTPTAQEVAEKICKKIEKRMIDSLLHAIPRTPQEIKGWWIEEIATSLATFAHDRERAAWEEAAQRIELLRGDEIIFNTIWNSLADEFRRRAKKETG